jgi:hypothetical protein
MSSFSQRPRHRSSRFFGRCLGAASQDGPMVRRRAAIPVAAVTSSCPGIGRSVDVRSRRRGRSVSCFKRERVGVCRVNYLLLAMRMPLSCATASIRGARALRTSARGIAASQCVAWPGTFWECNTQTPSQPRAIGDAGRAHLLFIQQTRAAVRLPRAPCARTRCQTAIALWLQRSSGSRPEDSR